MCISLSSSSSSSYCCCASLTRNDARIVSQNSGNQPILPKQQQQQQQQSVVVVVDDVPAHISRRCAAMLLLLSSAHLISTPLPSLAREKRSRRNIPIEEYLTTTVDGLKYLDLAEGKGPVAIKGSTVQVHFDCVYRGITAVSSRESKLLAGNRIIAQPYQFQVGSTPGRERKRDYADKANGLFSAQAAPKPPPALYSAVQGMKVGGKRTVIVPPQVGYGNKGSNEIPPGATFHLNIELLQVKQPQSTK